MKLPRHGAGGEIATLERRSARLGELSATGHASSGRKGRSEGRRAANGSDRPLTGNCTNRKNDCAPNLIFKKKNENPPNKTTRKALCAL